MGLLGVSFHGALKLGDGVAGLAAFEQAQTQHRVEFRRIFGLNRLLHEQGRLGVLALGHQCGAQQRHGLAIVGLGLEVGFQHLDGAIRVFVAQIKLREQLGSRRVALKFLKDLQVLFGFFALPQAEVGQAVEHQQLRVETKRVQWKQVELANHGFQGIAGHFGLVLALGQQGLQVGGTGFTGRQALNLVQIFQSIGCLAQIDENAGARHQSFPVVAIGLERARIRFKRAAQVARDVLDRALLVPRVG